MSKQPSKRLGGIFRDKITALKSLLRQQPQKPTTYLEDMESGR
jgi:hypothetical protein